MLAKAKLNSIEALISKELIDSNIRHADFFFNKECDKRISRYENRNKKLKT